MYENIDEDDSCPLIDLRIILKPISDATKENLKCKGLPLPPSSIIVATNDVLYKRDIALPSDFIKKAMEDRLKNSDL